VETCKKILKKRVFLKGIKRKTNNKIETDKNLLEKLNFDKILNEKWMENKKMTKKNYERINLILFKNVINSSFNL
jgi:hypothetical protein